MSHPIAVRLYLCVLAGNPACVMKREGGGMEVGNEGKRQQGERSEQREERRGEERRGEERR